MFAMFEVVNELHEVPVVEGVRPSVRVAVINRGVELLSVLRLKIPG